MFVEFTERFYPTSATFPDSFATAGQRRYDDGAHGEDRTAHVLGLFAVGAPVGPYQGLDADALRERVLFAGDADTDGSNWSEVHVAAPAAWVAVERLLHRW